MGVQQPGDEPRANKPADEAAPRRSPASRDAGKDDSLRFSDQGASPAYGDDTPSGGPPGPATADQKQHMGRRLWKQLTGSKLRKGLTALGTVFTAVVAAIAAVLVPGWISDGNPVSVIIAEQLGHKSLSMLLKTYAHVDSSQTKEAVEKASHQP